ncbi:MAG: serine hydrolase, partial [Thermoleophilia bacterium]|nr:serine hydrolase [Thermoleophilia bacterium]
HSADERFPLASVFKIPVMVEVMRQVDRGVLRLDERLTLTEADKSPGSTLIHCHPGLAMTVRDLLYLMITLSDNTATDMLWRRIGLGSVNAAMTALGLADIDCFLPDREYFLMSCGAGSDWQGLDGAGVVARWRGFEAAGTTDAALRRVLEENADLDGAAFRRLYDARWGYSGERDYDDGFTIDQALDNQGTPRDVMELLAMIAEGRCASAPSCRLMVEVMSRQEWREKIPAGLPAGLLIANKTGGVSGTSNDAALVYTREQVPLVMVVFCKGLSLAATARAPRVIARIAACLYEDLAGGEAGDGVATDRDAPPALGVAPGGGPFATPGGEAPA